MVDPTVPKGKFTRDELESLTLRDLAQRCGVDAGAERRGELRFDQR